MKVRSRLLCGLMAAALALICPSFAVPGQADDPVLTLSYIEKVYFPELKSRAVSGAAAGMRSSTPDFADVISRIEGIIGGGAMSAEATALLADAVASRIAFFVPSDSLVKLSRGAVITGGTGTTFTIKSGSAEQTGAALIDLTAGKDLAAGASPAARRRLMCSDKGAGLRITSDSAEITVSGYYRITPAYRPMFSDLCEALMKMGVVGSYDLERVSRRQEMFILFLTVLGEKKQAEAYTGKHPFSDVEWGGAYVAYLYDKSYTAGTGDGKFSPNLPGSVRQMSFLFLKALGYTDRVDMTYETAIEDAVRLGVFTKGELALLSAGEFRRDQMMYMCYYALFARYKGSGNTVLDRLVASGFTTRAAADAAVSAVTRVRQR